MDRYITTKEFADLLKVSRQTILKFAKEGCPHVSTTPGQQRTDYRFPMPEAEEWLRDRNRRVVDQQAAAVNERPVVERVAGVFGEIKSKRRKS